MKPICVPCQRFFKPSKNGIEFVEQMPKHNEARPGTAEPERWRPYKLWQGDQWTCQGCGATIIVGVGRGPIAEHFEAGFREEAARATVTVNDC